MLVVLMGVSGSGKSTIGRLLASRLGWPFLEADEYHPESNRRKLAAGSPLTDADRAPWLAALNAALQQSVQQSGSVIMACSALKDAYRDRLDDDLPPVHWVHLTGEAAFLEQRLEHRIGHFSSATLLPSQLATLEAPQDAIEIRVDGTPAQVVEQTARALGCASVDPQVHDRLIARHLFAWEPSHQPGPDRFERLLQGRAFQLERIVSTGAATATGDWYDQPRAEWVILLSGAAQLLFDGDQNPCDIGPGDAWLIPAHWRHRVEWTDPRQPSVWIALHFDA